MPPRTLYVTDLDGTLLPSSGRLPRADSRRLEALVAERRLALTYATARSHLMASRAVGAGWGTPAVVYNGAFVVDPADGRLLSSHFLGASVVADLLSACRASGLMPLVFTYGSDRNWGADRVQWLRGRETPGIRRYLEDRPDDPRFDAREDWSQLRRDDVFYVSVIGSAHPISELARQLRLRLGDSCTINVQRDTYHPEDTWLEVTPMGVTKATEIVQLAAALDVDRLVCFGDNNNDLPLFEIADESYAVANGTASVKQHAKEVIGSCDEGGVLAWLEENAR